MRFKPENWLDHLIVLSFSSRKNVLINLEKCFRLLLCWNDHSVGIFSFSTGNLWVYTLTVRPCTNCYLYTIFNSNQCTSAVKEYTIIFIRSLCFLIFVSKCMYNYNNIHNIYTRQWIPHKKTKTYKKECSIMYNPCKKLPLTCHYQKGHFSLNKESEWHVLQTGKSVKAENSPSRFTVGGWSLSKPVYLRGKKQKWSPRCWCTIW